jgi:hypothetical protein
MRAIDLPRLASGGMEGERLRIAIAELVTHAEIAKATGGAGVQNETLAAELSALFAAAKVATDAIVAQA